MNTPLEQKKPPEGHPSVSARANVDSYWFRHQDVDLFTERNGVRRYRKLIFAEALQISAHGILGHYARFFKRIALGHQTGQRRAGDYESTLFGRLENTV